jgi:hypothetical protein
LQTAKALLAVMLASAFLWGRPATDNDMSTESRLLLEQTLIEVKRLSADLMIALKELAVERMADSQRQLNQRLEESRFALERLQNDQNEIPADDYVAREASARSADRRRTEIASLEREAETVNKTIDRLRRELAALEAKRTEK